MVDIKKSDVLNKIEKYKDKFVSDDMIVQEFLTLHRTSEEQTIREQTYKIIGELSKEKNEDDYYIETAEILTVNGTVVGRKYRDTSHTDYPFV